MSKHKLMLAALAVASTTAFAQYDGAYYTWRDGSQTACAPTAPNPAWQRVDGPYFDGDCTRRLPARPAQSAPAGASAGRTNG
ncbi:hypothetical protein [Burkholderia alba]|uniref:hypothetical protein n=1 Tax=Burkholderia alba TaxID=2683677 RepID=UPI002B058667|nr:hypothetical protein [Burkholderia alba]